jgi:hypothetical protein
MRASQLKPSSHQAHWPRLPLAPAKGSRASEQGGGAANSVAALDNRTAIGTQTMVSGDGPKLAGEYLARA